MPLKSVDWEELRKYEMTEQLVLKEKYTGKYFEHWHCLRLACDPKWYGRGVGRLLTEWGLEQARKEGITAGLEASEEGVRLYKKCGMKDVGDVHGDITLKNILRVSYFDDGEE
jgi:GNAT superfamily N-acetyltransferase